jgi:RNA polymerase sigma factor (sigma-70 family)
VLGERVIDEVGEDRAATFDAFASRHLDAAYRVATAILGDPAAAQDATHDAFVAAWRGWPSLRDPSRFDAWFGRILVNTCRKALRRSRRTIVVDVSARLAARGGGGDPAVEADVRDSLDRAFARLSPDHRIAIVLRFYEDLTLAWMAFPEAEPTGWKHIVIAASDADGSNRRVLFEAGNCFCVSGNWGPPGFGWSPDGTQMTFVTQQAGTQFEPPSGGLFVIDADGTSRRFLTRSQGGRPLWRPLP